MVPPAFFFSLFSSFLYINSLQYKPTIEIIAYSLNAFQCLQIDPKKKKKKKLKPQMAIVKEIMGTPLVENSAFFNSSQKKLIFNQKKNQFCLERRRISQVKRGNLRTVAAISERNNLVKIMGTAAEKPVQFKVRAVLTVKNKDKEELKDSFVKQLDALTDKIGRNVVLQLVSIDLDPSKKPFLIPFSFFNFDFFPIILSSFQNFLD